MSATKIYLVVFGRYGQLVFGDAFTTQEEAEKYVAYTKDHPQPFVGVADRIVEIDCYTASDEAVKDLAE